MFKYMIRNISVLLIAAYSFYKLLNITPKNKYIHTFLAAITSLISISAALLLSYNQTLNWLFILLIFIFMMKFITGICWSVTCISALFSFVLSFIAFSMSGLISSVILSPFYFRKYEIPWILVRFFVGIVHFFLIYFCFRIPRLKNGMTFLYCTSINNTGSVICIFLLALIIIFSHARKNAEPFMLAFSFLTLLSAIALIHWWHFRLTQIYRKYLKENEIATLKALISEKDTQIEYFKNENDKLSRLIHKDNKMLPALTMAVTDFLTKAPGLSLPELDTLGSELQIQLRNMHNDRLNILAGYEKNLLPISSTGFSSADAILIFMQNKALKLNIGYQFMLSDPPSAVIPSMISEKDFSHLLSDLLDNAVIAAKDSSPGRVQIHMGYFDNIYTLKIFNTGQPFDLNVLQNLGISRHTTHHSTGGSGIGMMDLWTLKQKYLFTLLIDEITESGSKVPSTTVNILFNKKNHFIIQTDRYKELVTSVSRPDLLILSKE